MHVGAMRTIVRISVSVGLSLLFVVMYAFVMRKRYASVDLRFERLRKVMPADRENVPIDHFQKVVTLNPSVAVLKSASHTRGVKHCTIYDLNSDVTNITDCVASSTVPSVTLCLYPDSQDIYVSANIRLNGEWEGEIVQWMLRELQKLSNPVFLDLGANIGMFTNVIAKAGYRVVAVEPNIENVKRLQMGLLKSKATNNVTLVYNGLSDVRSEVKVKYHLKNQGDTRLSLDDRHCNNCMSSIKTIHMDDLLEVIPVEVKNVIIKIDIQGHEFRAMKHSRRLLQLKHVPLIFMEFMEMREFYYKADLRIAVDEMIDNLRTQGYLPVGYENRKLLDQDVRLWNTWTNNVVWYKKNTN